VICGRNRRKLGAEPSRAPGVAENYSPASTLLRTTMPTTLQILVARVIAMRSQRPPIRATVRQKLVARHQTSMQFRRRIAGQRCESGGEVTEKRWR